MATNPSRNGTRRLRASSRFATLDRREHRPPHVPVTPASLSASPSRSSPARRASSKEIELDTEEDKQDPAEVLAEYFHETMSNLAWLASAAKI